MSDTLHESLERLVASLPASRAVISPGSRNAAVVEALIAQGYETYSAVDERSAAFQAFGMAKASGEPVVLSCTSGTAALNYYPAIAEAFYARVPLIILTADRPKEFIDQWEGQSIRQHELYRQHCRHNFTLNCYESNQEEVSGEILKAVANDIPGPIHINIPIREPFYSRTDLKAGNQRKSVVQSQEIRYFEELIPLQKECKLMVVHGMREASPYCFAFRDTDNLQKAVVLADITSGEKSNLNDWDTMLYQHRTTMDQLEALRPDVLLTTGTFNLSKGLKLFLKKHKPVQHFHLSAYSSFGNPFDTDPIWQNPQKAAGNNWQLDASFKPLWDKNVAQSALAVLKMDWSDFNEFAALRRVLESLEKSSIVHSSNSLPVRYLSFLNHLSQELSVFANRGTSGIDGCSSTALGHALCTKEEVYLLSGDVAFFYDINAFYRKELPSNLKVILLNNDGGRIFEFIDGPSKLEERLKFQLTSHDQNAKLLCQHFGLKYICVTNMQELELGMEELKQSTSACVLEIITDPLKNNAFYQRFKHTSHEQ